MPFESEMFGHGVSPGAGAGSGLDSAAQSRSGAVSGPSGAASVPPADQSQTASPAPDPASVANPSVSVADTLAAATFDASHPSSHLSLHSSLSSPPPPPPRLQSNNPFKPTLSAPKSPIISPDIVAALPFKTLNRILSDIQWTVPFNSYMRDLGLPKVSLLNSKPIVYLKHLAHLVASAAQNHWDCLILNNMYKHCPNIEVRDDPAVGGLLTTLRGLLALPGSAATAPDLLFHFKLAILEDAPASTAQPVRHPVDKREYHMVPKTLVPPQVLASLGAVPVLLSHIVDESFFQLANSNSSSNHFLYVAIFQREFSSSDIHLLTDQHVIEERYTKALQKYPNSTLLPTTMPTAVKCFNTLIKVLNGPMLLNPGDQIKTINIENPSLNSQIDIQLLFQNLSFTANGEELTPPNLLENLVLRDSYIRKSFEIFYMAHQSKVTPNEFATLLSFSNNMSLVYRTFNEVNHHLGYSLGTSSSKADNSHPFFIDLSVCSHFLDELIIKCFEATWKSDKANKYHYVDSLKDLIRFRQELSVSSNRSSRLSAYFTSNNLVGISDYLEALRAIGVQTNIKEAPKIDDEFIVAMYLAAYKQAVKNYGYFNKKLNMIANVRNSSYIQNYLKNEIIPQSIALENLSIEEVTEDEVVVTAFEFKLEDLLLGGEKDDVTFLKRSLLSVAVHRKLYLLMNYIEEKLPELLASSPSPSTEESYANLGCSPSSNSFEIILAFQKKIIEPEVDIRDLRNCLKVIIETQKQSTKILQSFLRTGQIDVSLLPAENWPAGLDNIGNTCYLNSLLQYYFCLKPLRDMVLEFNPNTTSKLIDNGRKIGGRNIENSEITRSNQFILQLRALFTDMIYSEKRCVQPRKELAFLAFSPSSQPVDFIKPSILQSSDSSLNIELDSGIIEVSTDSDIEVEHITEIEDTGSLEIVEPQEKKSKVSPGDDDMEIAETLVDEELNDKEIEVVKNEISGNGIFEISSDLMDSTIEMGRQQDVTECIENVTFQIETALEPESLESDGEQYDLIKKLFYGKTKQKITPLNPNSLSQERTLIERFSSLIINVSDHPKDIYDSLDNYFSEDLVHLEEGEVKKSLTICELPEILQFHVQRVLFDRERLMAYKSLEPIPFGEKIYVDRYLDTEDLQILKKRSEVFKYKKEIAELVAKKEFLTTREEGSNMTIIDTLFTTKRYLVQRLSESLTKKVTDDEFATEDAQDEGDLEMDTNISADDESTADVNTEVDFAVNEAEDDSETLTLQTTLKVVEREIEKLTQEISTIDAKIAALRDQCSNQFKDYTKVGYSIFAIFIHRGEASYGHYWIYIKDPKRDIFRKYNDETVTEVPVSEVLNFEEGNTATPYYIVYAKELLEESYIEPLKREIGQQAQRDDFM